LNLGSWDSAIIRSLFISSIFLPLVAILNSGKLQFSDILGLFVSFLLYIGVFLLISILGWLFIGFPTHWVICKFTNKSYLFYALFPSVFICLSFYFNGQWMLGVIALIQALLFRRFVFNNQNITKT
jgi:hypothetical protein